MTCDYHRHAAVRTVQINNPPVIFLAIASEYLRRTYILLYICNTRILCTSCILGERKSNLGKKNRFLNHDVQTCLYLFLIALYICTCAHVPITTVLFGVQLISNGNNIIIILLFYLVIIPIDPRHTPRYLVLLWVQQLRGYRLFEAL